MSYLGEWIKLKHELEKKHLVFAEVWKDERFNCHVPLGVWQPASTDDVKLVNLNPSPLHWQSSVYDNSFRLTAAFIQKKKIAEWDQGDLSFTDFKQSKLVGGKEKKRYCTKHAETEDTTHNRRSLRCSVDIWFFRVMRI